jgi:NTP pyrophosphatase (non-canonical NTP hydrolase)
MDTFAESWNWFAGEVHDLACEKGWWETDRSFLECMGLVISELGEAVEAFRSPKSSAKILAHSHAAEELADVVIRIADLAQRFDLDIGGSEHFRFYRFDSPSTGVPEDNFVSCIKALMVCGERGNPIEQIATIGSMLGDATRRFIYETGHPNGPGEALADAIDAVTKLASTQHINLGEAIIAKHTYNKSRTYRHGAKLY